MRNPLAAHPPWRQLTIIAVLLPLMIVLAVLAFAWPAARIAPRDLPVGIVGTGGTSEQVVAGLNRSDPGGFDVRLYAEPGVGAGGDPATGTSTARSSSAAAASPSWRPARPARRSRNC